MFKHNVYVAAQLLCCSLWPINMLSLLQLAHKLAAQGCRRSPLHAAFGFRVQLLLCVIPFSFSLFNKPGRLAVARCRSLNGDPLIKKEPRTFGTCVTGMASSIMAVIRA